MFIGIPERLMKILARMLPPTPAWPENKSIAAPPMWRNVLAGGRSVTGPNRLGNANRAAKIRYSAKIPVITLPRRCGAAGCAG